MDASAALPHGDGSRLPQSPPTPILEVPFPVVDLQSTDDPIPAIMAAPEFDRGAWVLNEAPTAKRSLVAMGTQALIYTLIRNGRPAHVFEIGTYRGGTTEVMASAVVANGAGIVHTVGPFDEPFFAPVLAAWHPDAQRILRFYPSDSMAFFMGIKEQDIKAGLVLVDGNHDYEYASFDIESAARQLTPKGFIIVDNIAQAGPFLAVRDFLERNPGWIDCGLKPPHRDRGKSYDTERCRIPGTDIAVLRAPSHHLIGARPFTFGQRAWHRAQVRGLVLALGVPAGSGQLSVQCILRGFGEDRIVEVIADGSFVSPREAAPAREVTIMLDTPLTVEEGLIRYSVETWLIWAGSEPLWLAKPPTIV